MWRYMEREVKRGAVEGVAISLPIPARDPDLFKHKATNDVLLLLSRHRFEEFTIGELARQTGHTKPTAGRAVDVLSGNDLVVEESEGNRRLIEINRERLAVPDDPLMQISQEEFQEPVKAAVEALRNDVEQVLGIVLFGSVARGGADRRSDVDLWVLVAEDRAESQRRVNELELDLEEETFDGERYSYDIDVEEVASVPRYTENVREIVLSGITMYETEQFEKVQKLLRNEVDDE